MMLLGWSIRLPSLNMIKLTVPELGRLQFSIDRQLKVPIFTFFGVKGGQISNFIILTYNRHYLGQNDEYWRIERGVCPKMRPVASAKKQTKKETFMRQTDYLTRPPTSLYPPKILHVGSGPKSNDIFQIS